MKIVNINFNEITSGLYLSDGKKGLIIDVLTFTGLSREATNEDITSTLNARLKEFASDTVEFIAIKDEEHWLFKTKEIDISIDLNYFASLFPSLKTFIVSDESSITREQEGVNVYDAWALIDMGDSFRENDTEMAEICYQLSALSDFYIGNDYLADFLESQGRYDEAEAAYRIIAKGTLDLSGDGNAHYGHFLANRGRYEEAMVYFRHVMRFADTSPREGVVCRIYDEQEHFSKYLSVREKAYIGIEIEGAQCDDDDVVFEGKKFCLTGDFTHGSKNDVKAYITERGGSVTGSISQKTDYLVKGGLGSGKYALGSIGSKELTAMNMQKCGHHIKVITEDVLFNK